MRMGGVVVRFPPLLEFELESNEEMFEKRMALVFIERNE